MRPDPYKQARSRQYLARQRVKHGESKKGPTAAGDSALPRWIRSLPSNADRYGDAQQSAGGEGEGSEDDYDISSAQQLEELLEGAHLDAPLLGTGGQEEGGGKEEEPCKTYEAWTSLDIASLDAAARSDGSTARERGEIEGLPKWFTRHLDDIHGVKDKAASDQTSGGTGKKLNLASLQRERRKITTTSAIPERTEESEAQQRRGTDEMENWLDEVLE